MAQPGPRFPNRILFANACECSSLYRVPGCLCSTSLITPPTGPPLQISLDVLSPPPFPSHHRPRPPVRRRARCLRLRQRQTPPFASAIATAPTSIERLSSTRQQRRRHDQQRPWPPYTVPRSPAITPPRPPPPSPPRIRPTRRSARLIASSSSNRRRLKLRHNSRLWRKRRVQTSSNSSSRHRPSRTSLP